MNIIVSLIEMFSLFSQGLDYILIGDTGINESLHAEITGLTDKMEVVDLADDLTKDIEQFRRENGLQS